LKKMAADEYALLLDLQLAKNLDKRALARLALVVKRLSTEAIADWVKIGALSGQEISTWTTP
jgi:hypothetical protein